jgi:hypothetical protein
MPSPAICNDLQRSNLQQISKGVRTSSKVRLSEMLKLLFLVMITIKTAEISTEETFFYAGAME